MRFPFPVAAAASLVALFGCPGASVPASASAPGPGTQHLHPHPHQHQHHGEKPWSKYVYSPATRNPSPVAVHSTDGDATVEEDAKGAYTLRMRAGSRVSMDFGVEVGGHISFNVDVDSDVLVSGHVPLTLAFSESPSFVGPISDDTGATPGMDWDQAMDVILDMEDVKGTDGLVVYHTPLERFRGGFRFLTFNSLDHVTISNITCEIGFAPNMPELRAGTGYFYTPNDSSRADIVNRMWYAGAYTIQTNIAPADTGRWLPQVRPGWAYNNTLSVASPALVDGAKRDRAVWPGDLGIQGPIAMMAYGEYGREAVHNSLETLFHYQNATNGRFPFAGPATASFRSGATSDTYHTWALISMHDYALWSADATWLEHHWANITRGVEYIVTHLDPETGLQNQTNENDWARRNTGGFNSALNALDYHALVSLASLAEDKEQAASWFEAAEHLRAQYNALLWDDEAGLYKDNTESGLKAQDGNSLALLYGLPETAAQRASISEGLERNWNDIGPVTPELEDTISPFISGLELLAHLHGAENPQRAFRLLHRLWGYLLDESTGLMTGSTFAEGISANGSLYYRSNRGYNQDAAYTSLAHGWSAGPTTALVTGVLGLRILELGGKTWELRPQLGELESVRAGFDTGLGWFEAAVEVTGEKALVIQLTVPKGTRGQVIVPAGCTKLTLNGEVHRGKTTITVS